jgi:hypothetical protein
VFDLYLAPALTNRFELVPPGAEPTTSITSDIFDHLKDDDLVVAFLSAPYRVPTEGNFWLWNPNVMIEAGYRMGLGRPILFVREKRVQDDEPFLPFDLSDITAIELLNADDERDREKRGIVTNRIRYHAEHVAPQDKKPVAVNVYAYPAVTMAFQGFRGKITAASDDAANFCHYPPGTNLVGVDAEEWVKKLTSEMAPSQREAFTEEQDRLFGIIFHGRKPSATVCIVFGENAIQPGAKLDNAYLPIVTRFSGTQGAPTKLEVIYLNVTATAVVGPDGVVRCYLGTAAPQSKDLHRSSSAGL